MVFHPIIFTQFGYEGNPNRKLLPFQVTFLVIFVTYPFRVPLMENFTHLKKDSELFQKTVIYTRVPLAEIENNCNQVFSPPFWLECVLKNLLFFTI